MKPKRVGQVDGQRAAQCAVRAGVKLLRGDAVRVTAMLDGTRKYLIVAVQHTDRTLTIFNIGE
jgi:hypothetical protein